MKTFATPTPTRSTARAPRRRPARRLPAPTPGLQRAEIRRILHGPRLQTRLTAGAPDDAYEREADRVADVGRLSREQPGLIRRSLLDEILGTGGEGVDYLRQLAEAAARRLVAELIAVCNQFPASACPNSECPSCFCSPLPLSRDEILALRDAVALYTLPGIAAKVSPRVVPLWRTYIYGGSRVQDLSATFGGDFTASQTTSAMNTIVERALRSTINPRRRLPNTIDIPSRIPSLIRQINTPGHANEMNFNAIGEIPGNIAGGIGTNQTSCPVGAQPSTINDHRGIEGVAQITRNSPTSVTVTPDMYYVVQDTIDLCPGNCGADIEQIATLPFSWLEASGVSGDVPFTVRYPSGLAPFTVTA